MENLIKILYNQFKDMYNRKKRNSNKESSINKSFYEHSIKFGTEVLNKKSFKILEESSKKIQGEIYSLKYFNKARLKLYIKK